MTARRISQETFDDVVRENIEEFEMEKSEAVKEAIAQFKKQGIDLSNIDLTGGEGRQQLLDSIAILQNTPIRSDATTALLAAIDDIGSVCDRSCICSKRNLLIMEEEGGFSSLQYHLDTNEHRHVIKKVLKVIGDLSFQQEYTRDLFEPGGSSKLHGLLSNFLSEMDDGITDELLELITSIFIVSKVVSRSENNKNSLMKSNVAGLVVEILLKHTGLIFGNGANPSTSITSQTALPSDIPAAATTMWEKACHVIRGMSTFDDFRSEMSCAGDNGKFFLKNTELLHLLLAFGNAYQQYPDVAGASLGAIRSFVNTNEAVQVIAHHGVLELLVRCLRQTCALASSTQQQNTVLPPSTTASSSSSTSTTTSSSSTSSSSQPPQPPLSSQTQQQPLPVGLVRAVASLVRNVAADDHRKEQLVGLGVIEFLHGLLVLDPYRQDAGIVEHVFGSFAQITLRAPGNAQRWMGMGAADILPALMRKFADREALQRQACLSVRNIAGRCPELHAVLLDAGVETVLREAGKMNGCIDEAYSALRDLGCDVQYVRVGEDGRIIPAFEQFGVNPGKLNFRPVFEATDDLDRRIEDEGSAPFAATSSQQQHNHTHDDHDHRHSHHHHEHSSSSNSHEGGDCSGCR